MPADAWTQYRGDGTGRSTEVGLPLEWSERENVAWKVPVPGRGHSSPVVAEGKIWLTTALEDERTLWVLGFDARSGRILHQVEVFRPTAWQPGHPHNSYASPTPVVDEERVCASFGTYGLACLSTDDGRILWRGRPFVQEHEVGPGSSPIFFDNLLILHCDGVDSQYVAALDKRTGEEVWRTPRHMPATRQPPHRKAFGTPFAFRHGTQWRLLSTGAAHSSVYDPRTGEELWFFRHEGYSNVPMPMVGLGMAFVDTGFNKARLLAIELGGRGDVTETHLRWDFHWQVPTNPSPLLIGRRIYMISDRGIATWLDAFRGQEIWRERIGGQHYASPLEAEGRIYNWSRDGHTVVVRAGEEFEILADNRLDGGIHATPAFADGSIFVRTDSHLYRLSRPTDRSASPPSATAGRQRSSDRLGQ